MQPWLYAFEVVTLDALKPRRRFQGSKMHYDVLGKNSGSALCKRHEHVSPMLNEVKHALC